MTQPTQPPRWFAILSNHAVADVGRHWDEHEAWYVAGKQCAWNEEVLTVLNEIDAQHIYERLKELLL
jgi:hypothetical protein